MNAAFPGDRDRLVYGRPVSMPSHPLVLVAERAGHAAAARVDQRHACLGDQCQGRLRPLHAHQGLLVAMAMDQDRRWLGASRRPGCEAGQVGVDRRRCGRRLAGQPRPAPGRDNRPRASPGNSVRRRRSSRPARPTDAAARRRAASRWAMSNSPFEAQVRPQQPRPAR